MTPDRFLCADGLPHAHVWRMELADDEKALWECSACFLVVIEDVGLRPDRDRPVKRRDPSPAVRK